MVRSRIIHAYVASMTLAAIIAVTYVDWGSLRALPEGSWVGLLVLFGFGLLSEHQAVKTVLGEGVGTHAITFIPLLATVVLYGPAAPVAFMASVGAIGEFVIRRKPFQRALFNVSQYLVATTVAGKAFEWFGGDALVWDGAFDPQLLPFAAFGVTMLALNQFFVAGAISLSQDMRLREVVQKVAGPAGATATYDLLISPVALIVAFLYLEVDWPGLLLAVFPLLFIRHAYLLNFRLQQANRDLLKALVKAIETRDPYTSGHSLRVQALAGRIASSMGLPEYRKRNIEQAALLHDIGKIDAIYTEILKKPDSLSASERAVIESHVTKGVELLTSISSFPKEVIESVRSHHEREDGKGYPDGLRAPDIPLGAKIINVCDAIDAMLSDRPYRSALSIETVKEELVRYRGVQFDERVVDHVILGDLLADHADQVASEYADGALDLEKVSVGRTLSERTGETQGPTPSHP
ncbi:MAG: HD-GYP domain-containing protein [Gemmatimonadales bacterium]|nr:MAG: HD-GYP domain-containing protein [Gemmatimonadales bacterium]